MWQTGSAGTPLRTERHVADTKYRKDLSRFITEEFLQTTTPLTTWSDGTLRHWWLAEIVFHSTYCRPSEIIRAINSFHSHTVGTLSFSLGLSLSAWDHWKWMFNWAGKHRRMRKKEKKEYSVIKEKKRLQNEEKEELKKRLNEWKTNYVIMIAIIIVINSINKTPLSTYSPTLAHACSPLTPFLQLKNASVFTEVSAGAGKVTVRDFRLPPRCKWYMRPLWNSTLCKTAKSAHFLIYIPFSHKQRRSDTTSLLNPPTFLRSL